MSEEFDRLFDKLEANDPMFQEIKRLKAALTSIKTALGCPDLPVEEIAGKVGEVVASSQRCCSDCEADRYEKNGELYKEAFTKGSEWMKEEAAKTAFAWHPIDGKAVLLALLGALPIHPKEG